MSQMPNWNLEIEIVMGYFYLSVLQLEDGHLSTSARNS